MSAMGGLGGVIIITKTDFKHGCTLELYGLVNIIIIMIMINDEWNKMFWE